MRETENATAWRAGPRRLLLVLAIIAAVIGPGVRPPAAGAASAVTVEARSLVGGRYVVGGWAAVSVTLANEGAATSGHLVAVTTAGTVRRPVEMPAGARKAVTLYVQPSAFQRRIEVRYEEPNGTVTATADIGVLETDRRHLAIVGDDAGTIRPQLAWPGAAQATELIPLVTPDLPERPEPLDGIDVMIWAADGAGLGDGQRRAIAGWVAEGGHLVVVGGPDWQARAGAFVDLLPLADVSAADGVPLEALAAWTAADSPATPEGTVSHGPLAEGARALVTADDGTILASLRTVGAGRVVLFGVDLTSDEYRGWAGSPALWNRVLVTGTQFADVFGFQPDVDLKASLHNALGSLPALEVPPAELLLGVIVAYILLIGPISYIVLRRLDRRELAWVTAPVLVVLFTACSYGIGSVAKGGEVIVNQISLVRTGTAGGPATVETYAGIFSPNRATYDVTVDADALIGRLQPPGGGPETPSVVAEQGRPSTLRGLSIGVFSFEGVSATAQVEHASSLELTWRNDGDARVGTVTNVGTMAMEDVAYVSQSRGEMIGDLAPGQSAEFRVEVGSLDGSSPADQVYGFGGLDSATEEQRTRLMRRQVIDALVGYAGFGPGVEVDGVAGRGPYVIGWTATEGPMSVSIEGTEASRSSATVEIVPADTMPEEGRISVAPVQMGVTVTESEGNVNPSGVGTVTLSGGSATFVLSLPLDAAGMEVTDLSIVAVNDPAMLLHEEGSFFQPGARLEVREPGTGTWRELGDLAASPTISVDDPASVLSPAGTITVRVTAPEPDPNFGETTVVVSARAEGVLGK